MVSRLVYCERCGDCLGELDADGMFASRHHRRRFFEPVVVECKCGKPWLNPAIPINDERAKRVAKVYASRPLDRATLAAAS